MRTLKQHVRKLTKQQYRILRDFCHYSNSLYNFSLYVCNEYFKQTGKYIGYAKLWQEVKTNDNAKLLPAQMSRQTVMLVDKSFRSFFALLSRKQRGEYAAEVNPPHYRKRGDVFILVCPLPGFVLRDGYVLIYSSVAYQREHGKSKLQIPFTYAIQGTVKQLIIKPLDKGRAFSLYYVYEEVSEPPLDTSVDRYLAIDMGINNLLAGICYPSGRSFIVNGKPLKSYNRWWNKTKARLQSELEIKQHAKWSRRLDRISRKRQWFFDNYFNQAVNYLVNICREERIGTVVLGYNATWKQNVNLGKRNNQKFAYIPYLTFIQKAVHKLESFGIQVISHEESYTSKCSFVDREPLEHQESYRGRRVHRGLFRTKDGYHMNADCHGAANILRKVIGNAVYDGNLIVGLMLAPVKVNLLAKNFYNS